MNVDAIAQELAHRANETRMLRDALERLAPTVAIKKKAHGRRVVRFRVNAWIPVSQKLQELQPSRRQSLPGEEFGENEKPFFVEYVNLIISEMHLREAFSKQHQSS